MYATIAAMETVPAKSPKAKSAHDLALSLQNHFEKRLRQPADRGAFRPSTWYRDGGRHGGGARLTYGGGGDFNRASLNVSQVQYDDDPEKRLGSATALSCIVHPAHPRSPSLHIHVSWTEMKNGEGYWRMMADLNPSIPLERDRLQFVEALKHVSGSLFPEAASQGDRYFEIPALKRHRGVAHFYLEQYYTSDAKADLALAGRFGRAMIDAYAEILAGGRKFPVPTEAEMASQLAYHTVYLFQVLTLDRGTTSGLLVHDQNDVGTLGSLPARVNRTLLQSWKALVPKPQDELVDALVAVVPADGRVEDEQKIAFCSALRTFYKAHPKALDLQAQGNVLPPTVQNHRG